MLAAELRERWSREWTAALAHTMRALARTGARPGERTVGIGAPPGVHMSQRVYAAPGAGGDVPEVSALTPLDELVATPSSSARPARPPSSS